MMVLAAKGVVANAKSIAVGHQEMTVRVDSDAKRVSQELVRHARPQDHPW